MRLTQFQTELINLPIGERIFIQGPAGAGKTTAAVKRLLAMLEAGMPGGQILVLAPQRTLAAPYSQALRSPKAAAGGMVSVMTPGGLARRAVELFWPLVSDSGDFRGGETPPTFLTIETAQYYMAFLARPLIEEQGLFDSVQIARTRIYSQILDGLNKAALGNFPHTEIGERLSSAWVGEPGQLRIYQDVQTCADRFREFCLEYNLLDFSLQVEIFRKRLWNLPEYRDYLHTNYHHLFFENLEESSPLAHDLLNDWLPDLDGALLIYDEDSGFRSFLGADPQSSYQLQELCETQVVFDRSFVLGGETYALADALAQALAPNQPPLPGAPVDGPDEPDERLVAPALGYTFQRFYPEMLDWVVNEVRRLVHDEGASPGEIVILAPYLSDALRFSLAQRLEEMDIPARSFRPSRSLRDEPAVRCLTTLSALAHPAWGQVPERFDVVYALMAAVEGMDLVRAQLLTDIVYRQREGRVELVSFEQIQPAIQERITYRLGGRYEELRLWLEEAADTEEPFDHFLARLFGEALSQPGFGFHRDYDAAQFTASLIESVRKFRWVTGEMLSQAGVPLGQEYLAMLGDGVIAAQYLGSWRTEEREAVLLAPAYTFLMSNRPVDVQFWLDVGGRGWSERLLQPLTHPYVLRRDWPLGRLWTDRDEMEVQEAALYRLTIGLLRRCRSRLYLGLSELGESGYEERGPLLHAFQRVVRRTQNLE